MKRRGSAGCFSCPSGVLHRRGCSTEPPPGRRAPAKWWPPRTAEYLLTRLWVDGSPVPVCTNYSASQQPSFASSSSQQLRTWRGQCKPLSVASGFDAIWKFVKALFKQLSKRVAAKSPQQLPYLPQTHILFGIMCCISNGGFGCL